MFGELVRWNPTEELSNWHRDIDDLFGRFFPRHESENSVNNWTPRMETYRKDCDYVVRVDLPGVDPKDVQVEAEGNLLSITGERRARQAGRNIEKLFTASLNGGLLCRRA